MQIEIKHRFSGKVIFSVEAGSMEAALEIAVEAKANLRYANLGSADLRYANLRYADLGSADLRYANLGSANLRYANLGSADLGYANLGSADLGYADLGYADLGSANLGSADLRYANLRYADLGSADLIDGGQDWRGYRFVAVRQKSDYTIHAGCRWYTPTEAKAHWSEAHAGDLPLRAEIKAKLRAIKATAKARGWV